ncbi:MAG TPA: DUF4340 domain-containing protein [Bryobacteraceae bacterium]|nr:DUF4340 domain-containing protein [Bryobacteraceae bacterium]
MKPRGLLVAVVLLAVLGGVTWWSNKKQAAEAKKTTAGNATKIISIPDNQFQEIRLQKAGSTVDLKRESGKWQIVEPKPLPADQDAMSSLVSTLGTLNADQTIEEKATNLAPYGLNQPSLNVQVVKTDGKTADLLIGDDTPTGSGTYAKLANDPRVFTIASYIKSSVDKTPNDLRDKRLLTFDSDTLTRVDLSAKGPTVEFGKNNQNEWEILKPRPLRASGSQVDDLVAKLKDAKMDLTGTAEELQKAPAAFAAGTKVATVTVTDKSGDQTLEVRKDKDKNYYAKSSAVSGIYKVAADVGDSLDKSLEDFRNKKLFDFGFNDPSRVDAKNGAAANVTYTKSGDQWTANGKRMDNSSVQNLIDKLRDLTATKFADKGGGEPVFEARVVSNNGKRNELVTITKQGDTYFAQREGEPSVYVLDQQAVKDLQTAASAIKEAPPENKKK